MGMYRQFLFEERHYRVGREGLYEDGYRRKFMKDLGVPGCGRRGCVVNAEHGHDPVTSKGSLCKGMGWRGSDVGFSSRPNVERLLRGLALVELVDC